jgi:hypothetical protein
VSAVDRPRRHATPLVAAVESRALVYFAGSLAAHLGIWALLQLLPEDGGAVAIDLAMDESVTTHASSTDHDDGPAVAANGDADAGGDSAPAVSARLAEGQAGTRTIGADPRRLEIKDRGEDLQLARAAAREEAATAGILGHLEELRAGVDSPSATEAFASGFAMNDQPGAIYDGSSEGGAGFGIGREGFGPGGGGFGCDDDCAGNGGGWDTIASGRYRTVGRGNGTGPGYGLGGGPGMSRHPQVPVVHISQASLIGDYDKSIIRRYINRNLDKITYCYERELLAHPELQGEILAQFFIQPDGAVKAASGRGFDANVASCVAGVIAQIQFPAAHDGGGVQVNYPFTFRPSGR